jgi:hypothetical protein
MRDIVFLFLFAAPPIGAFEPQTQIIGRRTDGGQRREKRERRRSAEQEWKDLRTGQCERLVLSARTDQARKKTPQHLLQVAI